MSAGVCSRYVHHLDRQRADLEPVAVVEQPIKVAAVGLQIVHRKDRAKDLLHVADMHTDPDPCAGMRLDERCRRQMVGVRMRFQHHRDLPRLRLGESEDPFG